MHELARKITCQAVLLLATAALTLVSIAPATGATETCTSLEGCYSYDDMDEFLGVAEDLVLDFATAEYTPQLFWVRLRYVAEGETGESRCQDRPGVPARFTERSYEFCPADNTIYIGQVQLWSFYSEIGDVAPIVGLAHEFGHFMQSVGEVPAPTTPEESVHYENQADCFAGAWFQHADEAGMLEQDDQEDITQVLELIGSSEDDPERTHGTAAERTQAFTDGWHGGLDACNTYYPATPIRSQQERDRWRDLLEALRHRGLDYGPGMGRTVEEIARAAEAFDGAAPLDEAARMALADGTATVLTEPGGFALVHDGDLSLAVDPASRGRGIGSALLARTESSYAIGLTAWSHGNHPAAARLAASHGWDRVRDLWVMRRPTSLPLPALSAPSGVTVRGYRDGDASSVVAVNAAAFAHHPEQGAMDLDNLARRMAEPWFDPAGLLVAEDASGILGFHWTKQHDARHGEVYVVGIAPAAQGRGLGKLLTLAGLHHLAGLGVDEVLLYVESDNAPAVAVYSGLGFTHADADTHVQYRRP